MTSTFGERLRLQREQRQISLAAVAEQTKIKQSLLEALERDDFSHWPLGLFGRSYIRSYAQAVGLDPAATVREFLERHAGSIESAPGALSEAHALTPGKAGRRPPTRLEFLIDSAIDAFHARRAEAHRVATSSEPPPAIAYSESVTPRHRSEFFPTPPPAPAPAPLEPEATEAIDLAAIAHLCTRLGCAQEAEEVTAVLEEAAVILDLVGLILWIPDAVGVVLTPVFAHGYADEVLVHTARVPTDADNASAESFRTGRMCIVSGNEVRTGAIVAPLLTPLGCAGVLAVEVKSGAERREDVRSALTILAAQLSTLMGFSVLAQTMSA
jgi:transcriptional regulator with XRE-family HTH domain